MKTIIMALVAFATVNASAELVTETVCRLNSETSQEECVKVTYNKRPASPAQPETCVVYIGEASSPQPCATAYGVPRWMKALNKWFTDRGFKANEVPSPSGGQ